MTDMIQKVDDGGLRYPHHRPWLWLILVAVMLAVLGYRYNQHRSSSRAGVAEIPPLTAATTNPSAPVVASVPVAPATNEPTALAVEKAAAKPMDPQSAPVAASGSARTNEMDLGVGLLAEAKALEAKADPGAAREKFLQVLAATKDAKIIVETEERVGRISVQLALTPMPMAERIFYVVQAGDSMDKIARKYGTTVDLIQESNQIKNADLIKQGDRLAVVTGRLEIVVNKGKNDLLVTMNGRFFKRYAVGTGKFSKTPAGTYVVDEKQKEPVWWRPDGKEIPFGDKENILGTRWMSIEATGATPPVKGYGIHGTWDDATIGKAESAGCIRMRNPDVEELYKLVPLKTPVTIVE